MFFFNSFSSEKRLIWFLFLNNFEILIQWLASQGGKRSSEVKESLDLNPRQNQRFVSSTRNIEVLLSHTHSIVCDNDIGGLFLGCSKSCKMAAHNLKIHFNSLFMILHKKVSKMFRRVFSLIEKYVLWFKSMSFCNHWLEPTCFFGFKRGDPNFF